MGLSQRAACSAQPRNGAAPMSVAPGLSRNSDGGGVCPAAGAGAALLAQAAEFIRSLDDRAYSRLSQRLPGGTIGKHIRHSLDHFAAALSLLDQRGGAAEYDRRERNVPMETSTSAALEAIERAVRRLLAVPAAMADEPAVIRVMVGCDGGECEFHSTIGRELAFAAHHAVHHHAMIKVIADETGIVSPAGFGLAPSTQKYEQGSGLTSSGVPGQAGNGSN